MKTDVAAVRNCLKSFDFETLFREHLGWDHYRHQLEIPVDGNIVHLSAVAQKRGFVAFVCPSIPDRQTRLKIDHRITRSFREHFVIYTDPSAGQQVWQWVRREPGKPPASRDHRFDVSRSGDPLIQRLDRIAVSLDEEEDITVVDVAGRARAAFDVDRVTKKFYDRFKAEHAAFLKLVKGIEADLPAGANAAQAGADLQWYTSLMLNRLMFVYFIQKKGFLDGDTDYLRNRLARVRQAGGKDRFQSFYRYFLLRLFHDGLGKSPGERRLDAALERLLGKVPFLDGGFFEVHALEQRYPGIDVPDEAFEKLFDFFDRYRWHLDERPLRADNEINPDVVGYIFEKYINQKQMGAYYTREDITGYISKNTIIPFLFDAAEKKCAIAFKPDGALWRLLRDDPERYIYPAVRHGVIRPDGPVVPESDLPGFVQEGMHDPRARMHDKRYNLEQAPAGDPIRLVMETWREYVSRRTRCLDVRERLRRGEVHRINDLVTLNLDIWQLARDAVVDAEGPELLRAFWHAIEEVTVLDPTCGSGAFLFAALRILETLYGDCLERMERFVEDLEGRPHHPEQYGDFRRVLARIAQHPNERYFILKSIIINNLFGVDIMEEAVEICKLRLFLKLVAQVERVEDIEPLPDIDFNIRAGNTLVGYASLDQVKQSMEGDMIKLLELPRIEESAEMVERAFRQFRAQQTTHGGKVTRKDKQELRTRLARLDEELDRYLAGEYGVRVDKQEDFDAWKAGHRPFHWFVEFYGIMHAGGFDVIIGNPPYVEYPSNAVGYSVYGYKTGNCRNLYSLVTERAACLIRKFGRLGLIVPMSLTSIRGYSILRSFLNSNFGSSWVTNHAIRPVSLFSGISQRVSIFIGSRCMIGNKQTWTTNYLRTTPLLDHLFSNIEYGCTLSLDPVDGITPKLSSGFELSIYNKLKSKHKLPTLFIPGASNQIYFKDYGETYWIFPSTFRPYLTFVKSYKYLKIDDEKQLRDCAVAIFNSTLFYWFYTAISDCWHFGKWHMCNFPIGWDTMPAEIRRKLSELVRRLMNDYLANRITRYDSRIGGELYEYRVNLSKPIIDEIDAVLARHYGFTDEELDFIINYDIKYRMGAGGA